MFRSHNLWSQLSDECSEFKSHLENTEGQLSHETRTDMEPIEPASDGARTRLPTTVGAAHSPWQVQLNKKRRLMLTKIGNAERDSRETLRNAGRHAEQRIVHQWNASIKAAIREIPVSTNPSPLDRSPSVVPIHSPFISPVPTKLDVSTCPLSPRTPPWTTTYAPQNTQSLAVLEAPNLSFPQPQIQPPHVRADKPSLPWLLREEADERRILTVAERAWRKVLLRFYAPQPSQLPPTEPPPELHAASTPADLVAPDFHCLVR